MATGFDTLNEQSTVPLLKGIIADVEDLLAKQIRVAQAEIKADLQKAMHAGAFIATGAAGCLIAGILWTFALAHLLFWATSTHAADTSSLPLWACYAIVALVTTIAGAILVYAGREKMTAVQLFPAQTAEAVKENVTWKTN